MNDLFVFAAHNTVVAFVVAFFVYGLARMWRNPPVAHLLWLVVLLKLVAPPVMRVEWSALRLPDATPARDQLIAGVSRIDRQQAESHARIGDRPTARTTASATSVTERDFAAGIRLFWNRGRPALLWLWLGGAALCALVAAVRVVRFERLLRGTLPASERLQRLTFEIAGKLGVRRVPDLRYVECVEVPFLWCAGRRATIVLPVRLLSQLDDDRLALILAHELAHLRRGDHWVRAVEIIVSTVYWWNPLVWVIRRQIHQAEDLCCDAWVRWAFPGCTKHYAEVLLKTAESLDASQVGARLLPASPFLRSLSLKARIEMILQSRFAPRASVKAMFVVAVMALVVLPVSLESRPKKAWAAAKEGPSAVKAERPKDQAASEFPYEVDFEQGATQFAEGDNISILEVRGTAETFMPGHIYWIRGKYKLASHKRAMLAAYTTAMDAENAISQPFQAQSTYIDEGHGAFTLFLPMSCRGWPHVSFYGDGESFSGNYFGTGDSVLRRWWGSQDTPAASEFPHAVRFEQGATQFSNGDKITIVEVHGTADTFTPGNTYRIKGTYTLASRARARLAAYITASDAENGKGNSLKGQTTLVNQGNGSFTLILPMSYRGWPHVSFYPAEGGGGIGGVYFGTGESVLKP